MPSLRSLGLATLAAAASAAPSLASPSQKRWSEGDPGCMTWDQAQTVVNNWAELIADYSDAAANAYLTKSFTDYSESVNTLINTCPQGAAAKPLPLLAPTFTNRAEFKEGQDQQPSINFEQLQMWHTCSSVTARWKTTNTAPPEEVPDVKPVVGIFVLETVPVGDVFKIDTAYSEFDAGAWLQNLQDLGICGASEDAVPNPDVAVSSAPAAASTLAAVSTPAAYVAPSASAPAPTAGTVSAPAVDDTTYGNSTRFKA